MTDLQTCSACGEDIDPNTGECILARQLREYVARELIARVDTILGMKLVNNSD